MKTLRQYLDLAAIAHGHLCAGQLLGVRLALCGLKELGIDDEAMLGIIISSGATLGEAESTLYAADGTKQGLVVDIANGAPTGTVFNGGSGFSVSANGKSGPARFIFASRTLSAVFSYVDRQLLPRRMPVTLHEVGQRRFSSSLRSRCTRRSGRRWPRSAPRRSRAGPPRSTRSRRTTSRSTR